MKIKKLYIISTIFIIAFFASCVSLQDREITASERNIIQRIGSVEIEFNSHQFLHIPNKNRLTSKAYTELLRAAQKQYDGNIDIRNISISGGWNNWQLLTIPGNLISGFFLVGGLISAFIRVPEVNLPLAAAGFAGISLFGNSQRITARGDVVLLSGEVRIIQENVQPGILAPPQRPALPINLQGLDGALARAADTLINELARDSTIAILNINASNASDAEHVIDILEFRFVQSRRFRVVDRHRLEQIRREQNFQMSGGVSDDSAVSIGNLLGANIVITGNVTNNRLVLRVLDVQTAQIITMALEQF